MWLSMPAIMKGWIERVFTYGFAYGLTELVQFAGSHLVTSLFAPPVLNAATLELIAGHIADITTRWEWVGATADRRRA